MDIVVIHLTMRNKVREKMLVFFVLENPLKSLHKDFVYRTLKENFELDDKTLGYDFRPESFFPTSWGGEYTVKGLLQDENFQNAFWRIKQVSNISILFQK